MNYGEWLEEWLNCFVKPATKERTLARYGQQVNKYIRPRLGAFDMDELSPIELQKFALSLSKEGLAPNTVNGVITVLKSSLRRAESLGRAHGVATEISRPKTREARVECFTKEEQRKIERFVFGGGKPARFGIVLCLYTGLRIGELLALTWEDIDLRRAVLSVKRTCYDSWNGGRYHKVFGSPKTESSARTIPLPKQLLTHLRALRRQSAGAYVVQGRTAYGAEIRTYQRAFQSVLKDLGIPHRGFHALRHTFATRALEVGMDVKTLSEILGHRSPAVTLKIYAHSLFEHKAEMMNRVGRLLV